MKKHINLWLVMFLAISLALPIYSMAQTKLTLEDSTGNRISTPGIKSFGIGTDNNLVIYLDQPFNFTDLLPDISVDATSGSGCTVSAPATVTATQPAAGTSRPISFKVTSATSGATLSLVVDPEGRTPLPASSPSPFTFPIWDIGEATPAAVGTYLAVFQATDTATPPHTSQLVVMITINPPGYSLTVNVQGCAESSVTKNPDRQAYPLSSPETVTLTPVPGNECSFSGWTGDLTGSANPGSILMNGNKTVTATFAQIPRFTVTVNNQNPAGGSVTPTSRDVLSGGTATFTVTINPTYNASVSEGSLSGTTGTVNWTISNVTSTHTANINFSQTPTYRVTANNQNPAGGSVSPAYVDVLSGGQAVFQVVINANYTPSVTEGSLSGTTGTVNWTISNITSTHTANINFTSTTDCQSGDLTSPMPWQQQQQRTWYFCIPENRAGLAIKAIGLTGQTDATLTWTFPDGRAFSGRLIGQGTESVSLRIWSQNTPSPNIPDAYIPQGRHTLTITGNFSGFMSVGF
jgi:hypothetical protein